ncbi:MAG TPA: HRDC domain-containing protein [Gemmatimonadaceae bacterium]|nr:HRDC domain-containing protein [Gemmatimonadaceae bacterium]
MAQTDPHTPMFLDTPEITARFLREISNTREIAVDTEGASFHRFVDRIYLLQLSTRDHSAIIDPLAVPQLDGLGALMEREDVEVVFHDADYDLRLLRQDYGWQVVRVFDTRVAAQLLGIRAFGLAALLERYFGVKLEKKYQRADWSLRPLTPGMLEYAAQDTMHLLDLRDRMRDDLERAGRMAWAQEEFGIVQNVRWEPDEPGMGFMRIKGARDLDRRQLAVFREVANWRDTVAAELDRATFRVVGNEPLLELARLQPSDRHGLSAIKGMPRGMPEQRTADLLDAIARGKAVPDAELPRFPRSRRWDKDAEFDARVSALKTARDAVAQRLDLDPGVLCAKDRIEAVARRNPETLDELAEVTELRRWQMEALGKEYLEALKPHRGAAGKATEESPYKE